jgi:hypothetical protein
MKKNFTFLELEEDTAENFQQDRPAPDYRNVVRGECNNRFPEHYRGM